MKILISVDTEASLWVKMLNFPVLRLSMCLRMQCALVSNHRFNPDDKKSKILTDLLKQPLALTAEDDHPRQCLFLSEIICIVYVFFKEVMLA